MATQIPGTGDVPDVTPQALPQPYNSNRATPEDFGADQADTAQRQSQNEEEIRKESAESANLTAVLAARGAADTALNGQILNDNTGFRSLHGYDAIAASDKAVGDFDQTLNKIGGSLVNERQKQIFAQYALGLKEDAFRHVTGHLAQERQLVDATAYKSAETALIQRGGALPVVMDPDQTQKMLADAETTAKARAVQVLGRSASQAQIDSFTLPARAKVVDQVLETLLANEGSPGALDRARQVIADPETSKLLGGARTAIIEGRINRRSDQQAGAAIVQAIVHAPENVYPGTTIINENADAALASLDGKPNVTPGMLKVAGDTLEQMKKRGREVQNQRVDAAYTQGIQAAHDNNGDAFQRAIDVLTVPNSGPESGQRLRSLYEFKSQLARQDAHAPATIRAQAYAWNDAQAILGQTRASDTPLDAFLASKGSDGKPLIESLSAPDLKKIGNEYQKKIQHEAADKPLETTKVKQIATTLQVAAQFPASPLIGLTEEQIALRNHIQDHVRQARNQWVEDNPGKSPGDEDYQGWINEEIAKVPGSAPHWYSYNLRRAEIEIQQAAAAAASRTAGPGDLRSFDASLQQPVPIPPQPTVNSPVAQPPAPAVPAIKTVDDYNALPSGSTYVDPNGKTRRKP